MPANSIVYTVTVTEPEPDNYDYQIVIMRDGKVISRFSNPAVPAGKEMGSFIMLDFVAREE